MGFIVLDHLLPNSARAGSLCPKEVKGEDERGGMVV